MTTQSVAARTRAAWIGLPLADSVWIARIGIVLALALAAALVASGFPAACRALSNAFNPIAVGAFPAHSQLKSTNLRRINK